MSRTPPVASYTRSMPTMDQVVRHATFDGRSAAWSAVGTGPVLVIGGWWSGHLQLDWQDPAFRRLVERLGTGDTVVRYDRPGTGLSDRVGPPPDGLEEELAVLAAVIDSAGPAAGEPARARPRAARSLRRTPRATRTGSRDWCCTAATPAAPTSPRPRLARR